MGNPRIALLLIAALVLIPVRSQAQETPPVPPSDTSRLVFGPTGRMLAPGQGYLAFDALFVATVQVGVTRQFSMGGGTIVMPMGVAHPFWVTPKVQLYGSDRANIAAGVMHMFLPGSGRTGYAYTVGTFGDLEASMTVGGGVLYFDDSGDRSGPATAPVVVVGGERRYSPRVSLITENYLGPHGGLVSGGVRWRLTDWQINLGGVVPFARDFVLPGLWFSFARKFGG
jgi:hypothetical protein